jgi:hypothetical protein
MLSKYSVMGQYVVYRTVTTPIALFVFFEPFFRCTW